VTALGFLIPSSNTVVEPVVSAMLCQSGISAHYSRFAVGEISLQQAHQFDVYPMMQAARLLVDAGVDALAYCATSGSWLGVEKDAQFCHEVSRQFQIPCTSSLLSLLAYLEDEKISEFGAVLGYTQELVDKMNENFMSLGYPMVAHKSFGITDNRALSQITKQQLSHAVAQLATSGVQTICTWGTNVWAAPYVCEWEQMYHVRVVDSISVTLWQLCKWLHEPFPSCESWGSVFAI